MNGISWAIFAVINLGTLLGSIAIVHYSMRLIRQSGRSVSPAIFGMIALAPKGAFCAVIAVGPAAARSIGLGAPYIEAALGRLAPVHAPGQVLVRSRGLGGALLLRTSSRQFLTATSSSWCVTVRFLHPNANAPVPSQIASYGPERAVRPINQRLPADPGGPSRSESPGTRLPQPRRTSSYKP